MKRIRLDSKNLTLAFTLNGIQGPEYLYFGNKKGKNYNFKPYYLKESSKCGVHFIKPLLSTFGWYEHREYSHIIKNSDGSYSNNFIFKKINQNVIKNVAGLPQGRNPDKSISFEYIDKDNNITITLIYSVYYDSDIFSCYSLIKNLNKADIHVLKASSLQMQINENNMTATTFDGCWANERQRTETKLKNGLFINSSVNGSSSHLHNPLTLLKDNHNNFYGFNIIYSGNHKTSFEAGYFSRTNIIVGINDFLFDWTLKNKEEFITPEAIFTFGNDENSISNNFHSFIRQHLLNPYWANKPRPIIFNNWEGTYWDFTGEKILQIAKEAADLGVEYYVLDDGWFSNRNSDNSSLGDWWSNKEKTLGGLDKLSKEINKLGLKFGIWIEPEMISPDSDLFRNHPEYAMLTKNHKPTLWRNELMLDITMPEVKEFMYNTICHIIDESNASYVKHDYNRQMTEIYGKDFPTGEYFHRYMLSFYEVMDKVTKKYPEVLFEGCAGGGGRYDLGMLYYFSQVWTSDDTDPRMRILIQDGTLVGYPQITMTCHVSKSPNEQTGCTSTLKNRFEVALSGNFGYELDPAKLSTDEKKEIAKQIKEYKKYRELIQLGKVNRLEYKDIFKGVLISNEKDEHILFVYILKEGKFKIKLPHIFVNDKKYNINNVLVTGEELNKNGLSNSFVKDMHIDKQYTCGIDTKYFVIK